MAHALLFDFFGTLVSYDADHATTGNAAPFEWAREHGFPGTAGDFDERWRALWERWEEHAERTRREFSLTALSREFLRENLPTPVSDTEVAAFITVYLDAWTAPIRPVAGLRDLLAELGRDWRIVVVSNTYHAPLVPALLERFGVDSLVHGVVTSVELGRRKPDPRIYERALEVAGVLESNAVFIGDSFIPDFAGPTANGIRAYLLDPERRFTLLPEENRLDSLADLPERLLRAETASPALR
ncbi:HAD family hydrolase [Mycetocola spongiae]|uniref:HAD family hydrolase n=1 Tax=Mycetocola spongiae TaxID=2859226 RepID=UPI001CF44DF9|nr:HAD family hydrolase [Mycetocola spongiae]UCR88606.1 HAD family hydrolase [Mycetocola spongiae]